MSKVLIIKRITDDFDSFIVKAIRMDTNEVDVLDAFYGKGRIGRKIVKVIKSSGSDILFELIVRLSRSKLKQYDQIILFDDYPDLPLIRWIRKYHDKCVIKLWFWNVPDYDINQYRQFCKLYCFDEDYSKSNHITFLHQFYFHLHSFIKHQPFKITTDVMYVGFDKNRRNKIRNLSEIFNREGMSLDIRLIVSDNKEFMEAGIRYIAKPVPYQKILELLMNSKAILEIVNDNQTGLTLRSLEALFFEKKLITDNANIVNFDFYNKNNIFIYGIDDISNLRTFIDTPYKKMKPELIDKYSFRNWFQQISEEGLLHEEYRLSDQKPVELRKKLL